MVLTGHGAAVLGFQFSHSGNHGASVSFDRSILLWNIATEECQNYGLLSGHKNAILQVKWTFDDSQIVTASADKTVMLWDVSTGKRVKKMSGHTSIVNSVDVTSALASSSPLIVSCSNDCQVKVWDPRVRCAIQSYMESYQLTANCISQDGMFIYAAGIEGVIKVFDIRKRNQEDSHVSSSDAMHVLEGHSDMITSLSLSPNGHYLLSNSTDQTLRKWDVRPYVTSNESRCQSIFQGAKHNHERNLIKCNWSPSGDRIISGSSDRNVYIWDAESAEIVNLMPGHKGSVNEAAFHPSKPIVGSCGSDKVIFIGELEF